MGILDLLKKLKLQRQSKHDDDDEIDEGSSYDEYDDEFGSDDGFDEDGVSPRRGVSGGAGGGAATLVSGDLDDISDLCNKVLAVDVSSWIMKGKEYLIFKTKIKPSMKNSDIYVVELFLSVLLILAPINIHHIPIAGVNA